MALATPSLHEVHKTSSVRRWCPSYQAYAPPEKRLHGFRLNLLLEINKGAAEKRAIIKQ